MRKPGWEARGDVAWLEYAGGFAVALALQCPLWSSTSPCELPVHDHHIIYRQVLRRCWRAEFVRLRIDPASARPLFDRFVTYNVLENDPRNKFRICYRHHRRHHGGHEQIRRSALPNTVEEFADEIGLVWWLDRMYGRK